MPNYGSNSISNAVADAIASHRPRQMPGMQLPTVKRRKRSTSNVSSLLTGRQAASLSSQHDTQSDAPGQTTYKIEPRELFVNIQTSCKFELEKERMHSSGSVLLIAYQLHLSKARPPLVVVG